MRTSILGRVGTLISSRTVGHEADWESINAAFLEDTGIALGGATDVECHHLTRASCGLAGEPMPKQPAGGD
jgi:hypothetical protein